MYIITIHDFYTHRFDIPTYVITILLGNPHPLHDFFRVRALTSWFYLIIYLLFFFLLSLVLDFLRRGSACAIIESLSPVDQRWRQGGKRTFARESWKHRVRSWNVRSIDTTIDYETYGACAPSRYFFSLFFFHSSVSSLSLPFARVSVCLCLCVSFIVCVRAFTRLTCESVFCLQYTVFFFYFFNILT